MPVCVIGKNVSKTIYALLEDGSSVSLINESIVREIGADTENVHVALRGVGNKEAIAFSGKKLSLRLNSDNFEDCLKNVLMVKNLDLPVQNLTNRLTEICKVETGVQIHPYNTAPDLLIGQDNVDLILTLDFFKISCLNMVVSRYLSGWSLEILTMKVIFTLIHCLALRRFWTSIVAERTKNLNSF